MTEEGGRGLRPACTPERRFILLEYTDHFHIDEAVMKHVFSIALSRGGTYCDLFFEHTLQNKIKMEEDIVREATKAIAHGVGIRVVKGEGTGYAYAEDLSKEKMNQAALTAAAIADSPAPAGAADLTERTFENRYPIDEPATDAPLADKIAWVQETERAAKGFDNRVIKVTVDFVDRLSTILIATSEGELLRDVRPMVHISAIVVAEKDHMRQIGISSGGGRAGADYFSKRFPPAEYGREAARRAVQLLEAVDAPAGPMELILAPAESGVLLHESVGHPLEADFIRKRTSAYTGRVGDSVASELVTVIDDGTVPHDRGSINFDDEGTIPRATTLIENGVLKGYMHDRISAAHFDAPLTGNGRRESYKSPPQPRMTVTYLANGTSDPEEIFRSTAKGIFCKSFRGGQVDISNGDFVFVPIEAYLIERGRITAPVKNLTLIGNGPDVLSRVTMVGNDFAFSDGRWTCGKGQNVPVGVGLPTIKISEITVGGTELAQ
jgi:TldD protein